MNKNSKKLILPIIGVLLSGSIAGFGVFYALGSQSVEVVAASNNLKIGAKVGQNDLTTKWISKKDLLPDMYPADELQSQIGKTATSALVAGEPLITERISQNANNAILKNMKDPNKDYVVPVSIDNSSAPSVINVGDYVSMSVTVTSQNKTITGKVKTIFKVVQVNEKTIAIEVKPEQYTEVEHALSVGKVKLALVSDSNNENVPGTTDDSLMQGIQ